MNISKIVPRKVITGLDEEELRKRVAQNAIPTSSGNLLYHTNIKSRSAGATRVVYDIDAKTGQTLKAVADYFKSREFIRVDREIGRSGPARFSVRLFAEKSYPQIALMFHKNFFPSEEVRVGPADITVIDIPDWPSTEILVFPKEATTIILGSNYYGEAKMASLRMAMYLAREQRDVLGLHAGSKQIDVLIDREIRPKGVLVFGLSGTGKTTIVCDEHGMGPRVKIMQDDIVILDRNATALGTERNFYVKTDNITSQPLLLEAVCEPEAIWENVFVNKQGEVDFDNHSITTNGRAIIPRDKVRLTPNTITLDRVDYIFFNTRRYDIPPVGKLISFAQAAAFYMLGESIVTSADDPKRVGETKRVVGFDPFIIDHPEKNGNLFYEILTANPHIECFVLNTGKVGGIDNGVKITPEVTLNIVKEVVQENVAWQKDKSLGYKLPVVIPGVDLSKFDPYKIYGKAEFQKLMTELGNDRIKYLEGFSGLNPDIVNSLKTSS